MFKNILFIIVVLLLSSCMQNKTIVNIPEASGICYMEKTDSFFIVNDEGKVFEINHKGDILNKQNIGKYDFEGISCDNKTGEILIMQEITGEIFRLSTDTFKIIGKYNLGLSKKEIKKYFDKKSGAEGVFFTGKYLYISTQKKKNNLLKFELINDKFILNKTFDIKMKDLSGLTIFKDDLYILSDKNDLIFIYDLKSQKITKGISLGKGAWEGITFDKKGNIFLADDNGRIIKK